MRKIITAITFLMLGFIIQAQDKYFSKAGDISFYSKAPLEDIEAHSKGGIAIFEPGTSEVVARISIKSFQFEKKLMQEHFNENYLESDKYPRGEFKGKLRGFDLESFFESDGAEYELEGDLSIHGETNRISTKMFLKPIGNSIHVSGVFKIKVKDYNIKIPSMVIKNIAEEIEITLEFKLDKLN